MAKEYMFFDTENFSADGIIAELNRLNSSGDWEALFPFTTSYTIEDNEERYRDHVYHQHGIILVRD